LTTAHRDFGDEKPSRTGIPRGAVIEFDSFQLDVAKRLLFHSLEPVALAPKAFDVLVALITNRDRAMSKEDLFDAAWPGISVEEGTLNQQIFLLRRTLGDSPSNPQFIATVPKYGFRWIKPVTFKPPQPIEIRAIAILPLTDVSPVAVGDYFADGLTEALISTLGRLREVRILGKTSALRFRGVARPTAEIAKALGVDAILEGAVCRAGEDLRIDVRLLEGESGFLRWGDSFERRATDVLIVQREIAHAVARAIGVTVSASEQASLAAAPVVDRYAHDACLRAYHHLNRQTFSDLDRALVWFKKAIEIDPSYAAAHAGLANWFRSAALLHMLPAPDAIAQGKQSAERALECDPACAQGYAAIARLSSLEFKLARSVAYLETALRLDPTDVGLSQSLAMQLAFQGRFEPAINRVTAVVKSDALSHRAYLTSALIYYVAGQYEQALRDANEALDLDPYFAQAEYVRSLVLIEFGRLVEAESGLVRAQTLLCDSDRSFSSVVATHAFVRARQGHVQEAESRLREIESVLTAGKASAYDLATIYVGLRRYDEAIEALEMALAQKVPDILPIGIEPMFASLRGRPRFESLLTRIAALEST
jgi:TolB-like protein/Flp pilus assembly protein TadD